MQLCEFKLEEQREATGSVAATEWSSENRRRHGRTMADGGACSGLGT
jgi:hypothetical protein